MFDNASPLMKQNIAMMMSRLNNKKLRSTICGVSLDCVPIGSVTVAISRLGTFKLALQEGHSMVCPASSSGISKR